MNCSLQPYFSADVTGKVIDVVIANIELKTDSKKYGYLVKDQMIVITYQREVVGFTSLSQYDYNTKIDDDIYDFTDLYYFGSYVFLTNNASVKYYEESDVLYDLYVDARNKDKIIFSSITDLANGDLTDRIDNGSVSMLEESYAELCSEYALSLIEQSMVKEIETSATVLYVEDGIMYVNSEKTPSLNSVTLFQNGNIFINGGRLFKF